MRLLSVLFAILSAAQLAAAYISGQEPLGSIDQTTFKNEITSNETKNNKKLQLFGGLGEYEDCTVNIKEAEATAYETFTRRGIYFWAYGTVIEDYCKFWEDHFHIGERFPFFQPDCYFDQEKGVHRVDTSWFNDEHADMEFERAKTRSLEWWVEYSGCRNGANELCWGKCT